MKNWKSEPLWQRFYRTKSCAKPPVEHSVTTLAPCVELPGAGWLRFLVAPPAVAEGMTFFQHRLSASMWYRGDPRVELYCANVVACTWCPSATALLGSDVFFMQSLLTQPSCRVLLAVRYITVFGSSLAAPGELPYLVTLFDRATKNSSSGHLKLPKMHTFLPSTCCS